MLDEPRDPRTAELDGLVLLDLPDHDSTEVAHHVEVDRLVKLADLLVWVLDPQKYADAAIHDRYLRPLASHRDVMLVVLNHIDRCRRPAASRWSPTCERLLAQDGLDGVPGHRHLGPARRGHRRADARRSPSGSAPRRPSRRG